MTRYLMILAFTATVTSVATDASADSPSAASTHVTRRGTFELLERGPDGVAKKIALVLSLAERQTARGVVAGPDGFFLKVRGEEIRAGEAVLFLELQRSRNGRVVVELEVIARVADGKRAEVAKVPTAGGGELALAVTLR